MEYGWKKIKEDIYLVDGSLRDIYANNINEDQWKKWVNYVNENYEIQWGNKNKIGFEIIKHNWKNNIMPDIAKVFIKNIQINNHFFGDFENDIDPQEINDIDDHNCIINYMKCISDIMDTVVYLSEENCRENYLIKIYKSKIYSI
jgi:hypothetical protein